MGERRVTSFQPMLEPAVLAHGAPCSATTPLTRSRGRLAQQSRWGLLARLATRPTRVQHLPRLASSAFLLETRWKT